MKAHVDLLHFETSEVYGLADELKLKLQVLRDMIDQPIHITSGYRPGDSKSHGRGLAVDIVDDLKHDSITSGWRFAVLKAALQLGFTRIGIYNSHIHLDLDPSLPQGVAWWGESE
jgi:hypothetical protein